MKVLIGALTSDGDGGHTGSFRCPQCCKINTATAAQLRGASALTCSNCTFERRAFVYIETDDGAVDLGAGHLTPSAGQGLTSPEVDGQLVVDLTHTVDGDPLREEIAFPWTDGVQIALPTDTTAIHGTRTNLSDIPVYFDNETFPLHGPHSEPFSTFADDTTLWDDYAGGAFQSEHAELVDSVEMLVRNIDIDITGGGAVALYQGVDADARDNADPTGPDGDGHYEVADGYLVTVIFTPTTGHHIDTVTLDGDSVAESLVDGLGLAKSYTFTDPVTAAHTFAVAFAAN